MSTEKLDTQIRKEQIAKAALSILVSQGLKAMTMNRVAKVVGLVPSAIYRHFNNKDEMLDAVLDLIRGKLLKNVREAQEGTKSHVEALRLVLMQHVQMIREVQVMVIPRIVFSDEVLTKKPERRKQVYQVFKAYLDEIEDIIRQGQQTGEIRADMPSETLTVMFVGLFQPASFLFALSGGEFDIIEQTSKSWQLFRQIIVV